MSKKPFAPSTSRPPKPRIFVTPTIHHERGRRTVYTPPIRLNNPPRLFHHNSTPYPSIFGRLRDDNFEPPPMQAISDRHETYRAHQSQPPSLLPITLPYYPSNTLQYALFSPSYLQHDLSPIVVPDEPSPPSNDDTNESPEDESVPNNASPLNLARDEDTESSGEDSSDEDVTQSLHLQSLGPNMMGSVRESADFSDLGRYLAMTVDWARRNMQFQNHITSEERRALLLNSWSELLVLTLAQERYTFKEESVISRLAGKVQKVGEELTRLASFIERINLQNPQKEEYELLKIITLYRPELPDASPSMDRDALQDKAMIGLFKFTNYAYPKRSARMLLMLTSVCALAKCALLKHLIFKVDGYDLNIILTAWLLRPR